MSTDNLIKPDDFEGDSTLPRYERLKQIMLDQIRSGSLKPGDRIPTEVELCKIYRWSRLTISRALNELELEGVLTRIQGSGTYVTTPAEQSNKSIDIMVCDAPLNPESEYNGQIFHGIRDVAAENRLDVVYYKQTRIPEPQAVIETGVDGVLLYAPNMDDLPAILKLQEAGKPVVAMAMHSRIRTISSVSTENYEGLKHTVKHLASLGHRRIALVTHGLASSDVQERILGFQNEVHESGIELNPNWMLLSNQPITNKVLESWFDGLEPRPTAFIICMSLAFPLLHLAWNRQLEVPKDLSIVVTDDSNLFCNCSPTLSAIRQPLYEMGRRSLVKLLEMIKGKDRGEAESLPMELVLRGSVSPPGVSNDVKAAENYNEPRQSQVGVETLNKLKEIEARRQFLRRSLLKPEKGIGFKKDNIESLK
jgi:GntR family transcriptional regulator of arabinose operon